MTDDRTLSPQRRRELAAEHALGLLTGPDRLTAIALARDDADFRSDVAGWRGWFAPWLDEVAEAQPPERTWSAIEQRIGAAAAGPNVVQLYRRLNLWRGFATAAGAIAAALALILVMRPQLLPPAPPAQPAPMVATLASEKTADRLVATWDPGKRSLIVAAAAGMPAKPGKDHELWVIPTGGKPMPIGVMHRPMMRMTLAADMASHFKTGAMLAVSEEPAGGSPTGLPTGPVIASGALQQS